MRHREAADIERFLRYLNPDSSARCVSAAHDVVGNVSVAALWRWVQALIRQRRSQTSKQTFTGPAGLSMTVCLRRP
jgi:hypothetical protein